MKSTRARCRSAGAASAAMLARPKATGGGGGAEGIRRSAVARVQIAVAQRAGACMMKGAVSEQRRIGALRPAPER
ncbi:MAG: hypothetical protein Kow0059_06080 [Candidatus Sumerlaeia bacterium]